MTVIHSMTFGKRGPNAGKDYRLAKDFTVPAGTAVSVDTDRTSCLNGEWVSILVATSNDTTAEVLMRLDEAVSLGLVEEAPAEKAA